MANTKPNKTSFQAGKSGNPTGRPIGSTPRGTFRKMIESDLPEINKALVDAAKAGDVSAIKLIYDRIVPSIKPTAPEINMRVTGTLQERGTAFINAMTLGKLAPDQATIAMNALATQAKLVEQGEIVKRLDQLEALLLLPAKT
jgi:hypothetical protein